MPTEGQPLDAWLTDCAYQETYPNGPVILDPKKKDHAVYIAAWKRIYKYVRAGLKAKETIGESPAPGISTANYQKFVLVFGCSGPKWMQKGSNLRSLFNGSLQWVRNNPQWSQEQLGEQFKSGERVSPSGVHGVVFWWHAMKRELPPPVNWPELAELPIIASNGIY